MSEVKNFTIDEADWGELTRLSIEARNTPVIAMGMAEGVAGRDWASQAAERVFEKWRELGSKYGFDASEIVPVDERRRIVAARPLASHAPEPT